LVFAPNPYPYPGYGIGIGMKMGPLLLPSSSSSFEVIIIGGDAAAAPPFPPNPPMPNRQQDLLRAIKAMKKRMNFINSNIFFKSAKYLKQQWPVNVKYNYYF
jgi:hypothetical protein